MLERKVAVAVCATTVGLAMATTASFANTNQGTVTASALNIRSGPSTSYAVITKSYKGDKVEILESSNGWHKVKLSNGKIGWGSGYYISTSSNPDDGSSSGDVNTPSTGKTGTITTSVLNIRSGPSTSYAVITKSYKGNNVEILESSNGWYKVKLSNGKIGWGSGYYISTSSNPDDGSSSGDVNTPSTGKIGTITPSALNIRSGPSTSYAVITKSYKGDKVEILESSNGWYKIKLSNGKIGWGSGYYISTSSNADDGSSNDESTPQDKEQAIVNLAKAQLGKPYVWGAEGPSSFDCSGLTYYIYGKNGIKLPRVSRDQYSAGTHVSSSNLKPGDLLFSSTNGSGNITHVGIYIGNGEMIHAPKPGDVVQKTSINSSYWQKAYVGAKRVL
ncbi:C40 family peptidase [Romboutsia sp.]|uniref:C40 family peptidase n=1 Tax=Romboutsia sp. TaxID=1965302 RepID=UPI002B99ACE8|nr:SH3 domain-containing protein [Romboutsia sp.]HSQ89925.1 SH3 domain-containing protein [Romboutsia sp.]